MERVLEEEFGKYFDKSNPFRSVDYVSSGKSTCFPAEAPLRKKAVIMKKCFEDPQCQVIVMDKNKNLCLHGPMGQYGKGDGTTVILRKTHPLVLNRKAMSN